MDAYEKETGRKRETLAVPKEYGTPGTADYLKLVYILPDPPTLGELDVAEADMQKRWERGERTPQ